MTSSWFLIPQVFLYNFKVVGTLQVLYSSLFLQNDFLTELHILHVRQNELYQILRDTCLSLYPKNHSLLSTVEVKKEWSCTYTPRYVFVARVGKTLPLYLLSPKIGFLLIKPIVTHSVKNFALYGGKKVSLPLSQKPYRELDASHPFPHIESKYILILSFPRGFNSLLSGVKSCM